MAGELHILEESLKEELSAEAQNDMHKPKEANIGKYNNLRILMEPGQNKTPHFIVRIGISEAMYNIENGERMSGGLGADERYIRRWFDKTFSKSGLATAWSGANKAKTVTMKEDIDE